MRIQGTPRGDVRIDGELLPLPPSLKVRNHSPTGFSWGYGGSGPSQLALAVLLTVVPRAEAERFYMDFKWDHVCRWPFGEPFDVEVDVQQWLQEKRGDEEKERQRGSIQEGSI